eukprot:NODE_167_length_3476_cov_6.800537.p1 GENE.NODE_167_length_3476_cov_6.800537~~NODE_167_length_3476_cov_6.800537.p1  ORF type:complete len:896 (+),score=191.87 NODE_167_length_3476_cov_6.800537:46-2688(+)
MAAAPATPLIMPRTPLATPFGVATPVTPIGQLSWGTSGPFALPTGAIRPLPILDSSVPKPIARPQLSQIPQQIGSASIATGGLSPAMWAPSTDGVRPRRAPESPASMVPSPMGSAVPPVLAADATPEMAIPGTPPRGRTLGPSVPADWAAQGPTQSAASMAGGRRGRQPAGGTLRQRSGSSPPPRSPGPGEQGWVPPPVKHQTKVGSASMAIAPPVPADSAITATAGTTTDCAVASTDGPSSTSTEVAAAATDAPARPIGTGASSAAASTSSVPGSPTSMPMPIADQPLVQPQRWQQQQQMPARGSSTRMASPGPVIVRGQIQRPGVPVKQLMQAYGGGPSAPPPLMQHSRPSSRPTERTQGTDCKARFPTKGAPAVSRAVAIPAQMPGAAGSCTGSAEIFSPAPPTRGAVAELLKPCVGRASGGDSSTAGTFLRVASEPAVAGATAAAVSAQASPAIRGRIIALPQHLPVVAGPPRLASTSSLSPQAQRQHSSSVPVLLPAVAAHAPVLGEELVSRVTSGKVLPADAAVQECTKLRAQLHAAEQQAEQRRCLWEQERSQSHAHLREAIWYAKCYKQALQLAAPAPAAFTSPAPLCGQSPIQWLEEVRQLAALDGVPPPPPPPPPPADGVASPSGAAVAPAPATSGFAGFAEGMPAPVRQGTPEFPTATQPASEAAPSVPSPTFGGHDSLVHASISQAEPNVEELKWSIRAAMEAMARSESQETQAGKSAGPSSGPAATVACAPLHLSQAGVLAAPAPTPPAMPTGAGTGVAFEGGGAAATRQTSSDVLQRAISGDRRPMDALLGMLAAALDAPPPAQDSAPLLPTEAVAATPAPLFAAPAMSPGGESQALPDGLAEERQKLVKNELEKLREWYKSLQGG